MTIVTAVEIAEKKEKTLLAIFLAIFLETAVKAVEIVEKKAIAAVVVYSTAKKFFFYLLFNFLEKNLILNENRLVFSISTTKILLILILLFLTEILFILIF